MVDQQSLVVGYLDQSLSDFDLSKLMGILQVIRKERQTLSFVKLEPGRKDKSLIDLLLCFGDSDVLDSAKTQWTCPLLCVELPGDNSWFAQVKMDQLGNLLKLFGLESSTTEPRSLIKISVGETDYFALNDLYITSSRINSRMRYDIQVNGQSLYNNGDSANAVLVSTPTGSTAMGLNLGGAIVHPTAPVLQIQSVASRNPVGAHHIIPDSAVVEVDIIEAIQPLALSIDNSQIDAQTSHITIQKAAHTLSFLVVPSSTLHSHTKLTNKLSFEDTKSLTSTAKFVLHILQSETKPLTINEIVEITHVSNQKTLRNALKLLMDKGFVKRKENLSDLREHLYFAVHQ